jgi:predicted ATPase
MLKKLTVERFKSIRSATLELGRVNLIVGGNGAGKSNVLEAIGVLSAALERGRGDTDLSKKGVRITPPELMKSAFKKHDLPKTLQLTATMEGEVEYRINLTGSEDDPLLAFFSESCTHGSTRVFGRSPHGATVRGQSIHGRLTRHRSIWDQVRTAFEFPEAVDSALNSLSEYVIYAPQADFLRCRRMQGGGLDTLPIGLHGEGLPEAVRGLLKQLNRSKKLQSSPKITDRRIELTHDIKRQAFDLVYLPQWAHGVKVGALEGFLTSRELLDHGEDMVYFMDRFMHSRRKTLSVYDSSEGTLFLLFVAILLSHDDSPKMFSLDNVDSSLNPKMTRSLLETVIETTKKSHDGDLSCGPRQVFLTSHNPTSLDAFDLFDDVQRVFVVARNSDGHTVVNRLKPRAGMSKQDWYEAKNGRNLSQLWLDGEIRGALGQSV